MRRGFTLVEMLVAMVVVGIVGAALIRLLSNQQRLSVTQVEQAMLQSNVRVGTQVLASELQEMGSDLDSVDLAVPLDQLTGELDVEPQAFATGRPRVELHGATFASGTNRPVEMISTPLVVLAQYR